MLLVNNNTYRQIFLQKEEKVSGRKIKRERVKKRNKEKDCYKREGGKGK